MKFLNLKTVTTFKGLSYVVLTLNRPEVKNAFNPEMIAEITDFFIQQKDNSETALILLRGEGSVFCAGADLNWMQSMVKYTFDENLLDSNKLWSMFDAIRSCNIPVISIVQGAAYGGALGIIGVSDYVVAEESTKFCFSEVKLGLVPAVISDFLSQKIADGFLRPLMLSGEEFKAPQAQQMGLVQQLFSETVSDDEIVAKFEKNGFAAMRETKKLLNFLQENSDRDHRRTKCATIISERRMSDEGQKRLEKFLKR